MTFYAQIICFPVLVNEIKKHNFYVCFLKIDLQWLQRDLLGKQYIKTFINKQGESYIIYTIVSISFYTNKNSYIANNWKKNIGQKITFEVFKLKLSKRTCRKPWILLTKPQNNGEWPGYIFATWLSFLSLFFLSILILSFYPSSHAESPHSAGTNGGYSRKHDGGFYCT